MFKSFEQLHLGCLIPTGTSSSIRHRLDVEIPRGKFVEITSILKGESTWKLWHRFDVDISTWIRLSKSTKYRWVLHVDFSMAFQRQVETVGTVGTIPFGNIATMQINRNNDKFYFLQNNPNRGYNASITKNNTNLQNITKQSF